MTVLFKLMQITNAGYSVNFCRSNDNNLIQINISKAHPKDGLIFTIVKGIFHYDFDNDELIISVLDQSTDEIDNLMYKRSNQNINTCNHREVPNNGNICCEKCLAILGIHKQENLNNMIINIRNQ